MKNNFLKIKLAFRKKVIEKRLNELIDIHAPVGSKELVKEAICSNGMRYRPLLTLTVCDALGGNWKESVDAACAIEVLHKASLIHDDIVDEDELRRGEPTLWKIYGKKQSIIIADLLIGICFKIASSLSFEPPMLTCQIIGSLSDCLSETAYGEIQDLKLTGDSDASDQDLSSMLYNKSGYLMSNSMKIGSLIAGGTETEEKIVHKVGYELGYLFQILNDLEDTEKVGSDSKGNIGLDIERKQLNLVTLCIQNADMPHQDYLLLDSIEKSIILEPIIHKIDKSTNKVVKESNLLQNIKFSQFINTILNYLHKNIVNKTVI
jgi:geranylgeranyl pyrophosphate synthase